MKNSEIFLEKFNEIESYLKKSQSNKHFNGFTNMVRYQSKNNKVLSMFQDDLREFAQLRNAIIHGKRHGSEVIAEPAQFVVNEISKISTLLHNPPKISEAYQCNEVLFLQSNESLLKAIGLMSSHSYSQIPIYVGKKYHDVLSSNTIVRLLGQNTDVKLSNLIVEDVLQYKNPKEYCEFISSKENLFTAVNIFENEQKNRDQWKVEAIIITKHGSKEEYPIGIITHTDLPRVLKELNL